MYATVVIALLLAFPLISIVANRFDGSRRAARRLERNDSKVERRGVAVLRGRNRLQNLALVTDLFAAVMLATCCFA
ncbi:MAG: hypothetical protein ABI356_14665 [Steroidobacteraceae bacterium]